MIKCHFAIPWPRSCQYQYQCVCKILSKYSKRFKSYKHFSQTVRGQNLRNCTGKDTVIIGHTPKVKLQLLCRSTFFGSCNFEKVKVDKFSLNQTAYCTRKLLKKNLCDSVVDHSSKGWLNTPFILMQQSSGQNMHRPVIKGPCYFYASPPSAAWKKARTS